MPFLRNAWYCAGWSDDVGPDPIVRVLLDEPVLMFRDMQGALAALSDRCPHRFAPLHKGVLQNGIIGCPYHGLQFNAAGQCVRNPHGGPPPRAARLKVYPICERQGVIWIWMGDADKADAGTIIDLNLIGGEGHPRVTGHLRMAVNYTLVIDNLLDLTHASYLHAGTLSPAGDTREGKFSVGGDWARSDYLMRAVETPPSQRPFFNEEVGDYHTSMMWSVPSNLLHQSGMTSVDSPFESGAIMAGAHLLTPESENSTHYFFAVTRNIDPHNIILDQIIRDYAYRAFTTEDEPMMAACQDYMGNNPNLFDLNPILLKIDHASVHARRVLNRLIALEGAEA